MFGWFAGYRMRFFADQGLVGDVFDVWSHIGDGFSAAMKQQSTGNDGKQYFVPLYYLPWAVFYRKSVWQDRGYAAPSTLDDLVALCRQMRADGLVPIAFGDSEGWPAMGTFDHLNLRTNGYDYHVQLMAGEKPWNPAEVRTVFETWLAGCPTTSRTRWAGRGRRPRSRCSARRPGCTCTAFRWGSSSPRAPTGTTWSSSRSRRSTRPSAPSCITQCLDRDTRPDFASTVMIPALQEFIRNPVDIDGITLSIESQIGPIFSN